MVTVERFLMVHDGKLYELRTDGDFRECMFHKLNNGPCAGCHSDDTFSRTCVRMALELGDSFWYWREL